MAAAPGQPTSIVFKTATPTPAQTAQINAAKPTPSRLVSPPNLGPATPWLNQHYGVGSQKLPPVKTTSHGFVKSPVSTALAHFVHSSAKAANDPSAYGSKSKSAPVSSHTPVLPPVLPHGNPGDAAAAAGVTPSSDTRKPAGVDPYTGFAKQGSTIGTSFDPNIANLIASGQWDPTINDFANQIRELPGQITQNKTDIGNWMDQVLSSLASAKTNNDKAFSAAGSSLGDTTKGIMASLGGEAMGGSNVLAQQGANAQAMMAALSANSDSFSNDMKPILQLEKTGQLTAQDASQVSLMRELKNSLAGAQGSKASAAAQSGMDIQTANNALAQQRFQNAFGVQQQKDAATAAANSGLLNYATKTAQINNINARTNAITSKGPGVPKGAFEGATGASKLTTATQIINAVNGLKAQNGNLSASTIVGAVNHLIGATGWSLTDPKVMAWRNQLLSNLNVDPHTQSLITSP